ncbi:MAG: aryl-sulfate sulfotransferase [Deltaproteobacteria bacterium]|nr:aryl-sulfate sulfotransferase [Deltaproteobacteria bacterium]
MTCRIFKITSFCLWALCWGCVGSNGTSPAAKGDWLDTETVDSEAGTGVVPVDTSAIEQIELSDVGVTRNPYNRAPLCAIISAYHNELQPADVTEIHVTVSKKGGASDLAAVLNPRSDAFLANFDMSDIVEPGEVGIPILGLYADYDNDVAFQIRTPAMYFNGRATISTGPLSSREGELVTVPVLNPEKMEPGWTYLNDQVFDHDGNIRWMGPPIHRIRSDGNIISRLDDHNWLGKKLVNRTLPSNLVHHHDTVELPGGNTLIGVTDHNSVIINYAGETVEAVQDAAVEYDNRTGKIVNYWDLREFLDVNRATWLGQEGDWFHLNTLCYDNYDDSVIMSGRHQGIVALTRGGILGATPNAGKQLKWILSPHMGWNESGWNGLGERDPRAYLLTAVDPDGVPYSEDVQNNIGLPAPNADDFFWPSGQHGLVITYRAKNIIRLLTFNNEASIIYDGADSIDNGSWFDRTGDRSNDRAETPFSQIIEYEIDEAEMTVKQIWRFGENMPALYGAYQSGVDVLPVTGNRMVVSTGVDMVDVENNPRNPTVIELNADNEIVFYLEIKETTQLAYRGGRIDLYHPGGE